MKRVNAQAISQRLKCSDQCVREGDVRLLVFRLPTNSPWLNPMEPSGVHAKRQVCEPADDLTAYELQRRQWLAMVVNCSGPAWNQSPTSSLSLFLC